MLIFGMLIFTLVWQLIAIAVGYKEPPLPLYLVAGIFVIFMLIIMLTYHCFKEDGTELNTYITFFFLTVLNALMVQFMSRLPKEHDWNEVIEGYHCDKFSGVIPFFLTINFAIMFLGMAMAAKCCKDIRHGILWVLILEILYTFLY
jgi:hypothetical protein